MNAKSNNVQRNFIITHVPNVGIRLSIQEKQNVILW